MFYSPLEQFNVLNVYSVFFWVYDFSISNVLIPLILLIFLLCVLLFFFSKRATILPSIGVLSFLEILFLFVYSTIIKQAGVNSFIYVPLLFSLFNFLLFCNFLSLTPFSVALTSYLIINIFLSFTLVSSVFLIGLFNYNLKFLRLFIPSSPFFLLLLLVPIEIFSYIVRAFSLAIRLTANIIAGHTLVFIISTFLLQVTKLKPLFFFLIWCLLFLVFLLEMGMAFLQAYVFVVLVCIYLADSISFEAH